MALRLMHLKFLPSSPPALSFGTHHHLCPIHAILWRYGGVEGQAICRLQKMENLRIYIYKIKKNTPACLPCHCCHHSSCLHCTGGACCGDGGHVLTCQNDGGGFWTRQHMSKGSKVLYIKKLGT